MRLRSLWRAFAPLAGAVVIGCTAETSSPAVADHFEVVQGGGQTGSPGVALDSLIVVRLLDEAGAPMPGVPILWVVASGGGAVTRAVDTTGDDGAAAMAWTLGLTLEPQELKAQSREGTTASIFSQAQVLTLASLTVGATSSCGIAPSSEGWCWGDGLADGDGTLPDEFARSNWHPRRIAGGHQFKALAIGYEFGCGLDLAGATWCWGQNEVGQLGVPTASDPNCYPQIPCTTMPIQVPGAPIFDTLVATFRTICGVTPAGEAWCWGDNRNGTTGSGIGTPSKVGTPTPVATSDRYVQLVAAATAFCGRRADGVVACWGNDNFAPTAVATTERFVALIPADEGTCARNASGEAFCWGTFGFGAVPTRAPNLDPFIGIDTDALGRSYGIDQWGQLFMAYGAGAFARIGAGLRFTSISAGGETACGLGAGGHPWCWGANYNGQLGNPEMLGWSDSWVSPRPVGAPAP